MNRPLLEMQNATIRFGGLTAVGNLNLRIDRHELVGLIGPNGAGKTTAFNLISGVYQPTDGHIFLEGVCIDRRRPHELTKLGIARTFQNIRLFPSLSVIDNVRVATQLHRRQGMGNALWRGRAFREGEQAVEREARDLLGIFDLAEVSNEEAKSLPYGAQRRLEIVRALATKPKLLLLDEPAAGMNPIEKESLMRLIQFIKEKFDIAILLVEHDMKVVMGICQRIAVLEYGKKIAEGTPNEIQRNADVIAAYLGTEDEEGADDHA